MKPAAKTALITLLIGWAWIWGSDYYLHIQSHADRVFEWAASIKGSFFVAAISTVVYLLIRRNERSLLQAETSYKAMYVGNPEAMLICDPSSLQILDCNSAASDQYGFTRDALLKMTLNDLRISPQAGFSNQTVEHRTGRDTTIFVDAKTGPTTFKGKKATLVSLRDITEKEELHNALQQRERLLDALAISDSTFLIRVGFDGIFAFTNKAFNNTFRHIASNFEGVHISETLHPDDIEKCIKAVEFCIEHPGSIKALDLRSPSLVNNEWIHTSWELMTTLDEKGKVSGVQGVGMDSSAIEKFRGEGQKSKAQLEVILDSVIDGFFLLDLDLNVELANSVFAELVDKKVEDIQGKHLSLVIPNFKNTRSSVELPRAIKEQKSNSFEAYNPYFDKWFFVSAYPYPNGLTVFYRDITADKKNELEVKTNETNLRSVINTTRDYIWSIDSNYKILVANNAILDLLARYLDRPGKTGDHAIPDAVEPDLKDLFAPLYERALRGENIQTVLDLTNSNSNANLLDIRMSPIRDETNSVLGAACFARDITQSEQQRVALEKAVERYAILSEVTMDAIWDLDLNSNQIEWSEGIQKTFGYNVTTTDLDWWAERVHDEDRDIAVNSLDESIKRGDRSWSCEYRFKHADGHYLWVIDRGIVNRDDDNSPSRMLGSLQDINLLKETRDEIEKLSHIAKHTSTGVLVTNVEGMVEWCNEAFERLSGYSLPELSGKKPGLILQGPESDPATIRRLSAAIKEKKDITVELINYHKDGKKYWVRMTISPIWEGDQVKRFIAIETDITKDKQVANRLQLQNENLRKIAFILSHDLRKPVSSILGLLALYDKESPQSAMNVDIIKYLHTATSELDNMIHEIIKQSSLIDD